MKKYRLSIQGFVDIAVKLNFSNFPLAVKLDFFNFPLGFQMATGNHTIRKLSQAPGTIQKLILAALRFND